MPGVPPTRLLPPPKGKANARGRQGPLPPTASVWEEWGRGSRVRREQRKRSPLPAHASPTRKGPSWSHFCHNPALSWIPPTVSAWKRHPSTQATQKTHPFLHPLCLLLCLLLFPLHLLLPRTPFRKSHIKECTVVYKGSTRSLTFSQQPLHRGLIPDKET